MSLSTLQNSEYFALNTIKIINEKVLVTFSNQIFIQFKANYK